MRCCCANDPAHRHHQIGIYQAQTTRIEAAPGTAVGTVNRLGDIKLVQPTATIPGRLGVRFGLRYNIVGQTGAKVGLKMVTLIPKPGIHNPNTGNTTVHDEYLTTKTIGTPSYRDYGFDNPWEIVPGTWTFEIWDGDRRLASQNFIVVAP